MDCSCGRPQFDPEAPLDQELYDRNLLDPSVVLGYD